MKHFSNITPQMLTSKGIAMKMKMNGFVLAALLVGTFSNYGYAGIKDDVIKRGTLKCGVSSNKMGFSYINDDGQWAGMDVDLCRAVAAAVIGDPSKVEYVVTTSKNRFTSLASGEIDILSRSTTWTVGRDAKLGADFTAVWFYDGQGFMTHKKLGITSAKELDGATFCLNPGTTSEHNLADYFSALGLSYRSVVFEKTEELYAAYQKGRCDALTNDVTGLAARRTLFQNPEQHVLLPEVISKEPLGAYVKQGDNQWRDIVTMVGYALIEGEELNVTQDTAAQLATHSKNINVKRLLGTEGDLGQSLGLSANWAAKAIQATGNYGELYARNVGSASSLKFERGVNALHRDGGLMYAPPFR
ncbi:amino acid ABC transporter substrate-binding protein [Photobacterium sp. 1_MG-2023]|uniref:amino acid ABC transporter substrate-binding protein n=1 Tax=Photobacterium sp. 1_MG-2023 TaxID=3062646 RepID=UPI0026E23505|nr:amino acid ABC transporter substrate-binding protein [Photobacterium sp. 1_MG-2023]MDO6706120.1 amino acid ABC transporter substrate-binding protein [Photobacterium sp. 1_MG-2023]